MSRSVIVTLALAIGIPVLIAGCAAPEYTPTLYYAIEPVIEVAEAQPTGASLGMRPIQADRPYRQRMMFRERGHTLHAYFNAEWAKGPSEAAGRALLDAITETGGFGDVSNAADMRRPDYILLGNLRRFEEDRTREEVAAVVEGHLELRRGVDRSVVWTDIIRASHPLEGEGPNAYAEAVSEALGQWASLAAEQIATSAAD